MRANEVTKRDVAFRMIVEKMTDRLVNKGLVEMDTVKDLAEQIEQAVFDHTMEFVKNNKSKVVASWSDVNFTDFYVSTWRHIYLNLLIPQNNLRNRIFVEKNVEIPKLPKMSNDDLYHGLDEEYKAEVKAKAARWVAEHEGELPLKDDGPFKCMKCFHRYGPRYSYNVDYYQLQTRSADESMTTYVNCLRCMNRWKC